MRPKNLQPTSARPRPVGQWASRGRPSTGDVGGHQVAQPTARFQRQPVFREPVQDDEVSAGLSRSFRLARRRPRFLPRLLRLVQRGTLPLGHRAVDSGNGPLRTCVDDPCCPTRRTPRRLHGASRAFRPSASIPTRVARSRVDQSTVLGQEGRRASGNRRFPEARCTFGAPSIRLSLARLRPRRA